jgi:hypothetical protein
VTDARRAAFGTIVLPERLGLARDPVSPPNERGPDYMATYDTRTLVYDAVHLGRFGRVQLICPKLLNLEPLLDEATLALDGRPVRVRRIHRHRRYDVAEIDHPAPPRLLTVELRGWRAEAAVSADDGAEFAGRNVLLTLSKDNPLVWVRDWARWHVELHGADAVLFFDNGSTAYPPEALVDTLAGVPGLKVVRVASIDRPYGPIPLKGSRSKAMYLQTALLNVARLRFLGRARAVLQNDVDELVIGADGRSIFDAAATARAGLVKFRGLWRTPEPPPDGQARHADHVGVLDDAKPCPTKYCVVPSGRLRRHSWNTHTLDRLLFSGRFESAAFHYLHCRGISTRWKSPTSRGHVRAAGTDAEAAALFARLFSDARSAG